MVVPILLEIPDITESTTLSETLGLELWYERIRNGESQRIDSLVRIPLVIQVDVISVSNEWLGDTPSEIVLYQNYPNPFNPVTTISYSIPIKSQVELVIYNTLGERIKKLVNKEKEAGSYQIEFDATVLPSGIYFYRLQAGSFVETKKMVLLK